jgi:CheY-like chemotaxis protein
MMTNATGVTSLGPLGEPSTLAVRKMAIVNGDPDVLELLQPVIDTEEYAVIFVDSARQAYSDIKRLQPNIIILCVDLNDSSSFQVLSMLKLDAETRRIPLVTFTSSLGFRNEGHECDERPDPDVFFATRPLWMH